MTQTTIAYGRWLITGGGKNGETIENGAVLIDGDTIAEIGTRDSLTAAHPDAAVIGSPDHAILPGLINAHHHSAGASVLQHGVADELLETWLLARRRMRASDIYLDTLLSSARLLATGVTCVVDVHSGGGDAQAYDARIRRALRAYDEAGLRVAFTAGVTKRSYLVSGEGEDERFLDDLPPAIRKDAELLLPEAERLDEADYLGLMDSLGTDHADHPTIDIWYGPPGPQWVSDRFLGDIVDAARRHGTGVQTHVEESFYEKLHGPREYGTPTVLHLRDLGVLHPRFSIAHGVWVTEPEIEALAETGACVAHNPSSNLRLRAGVAPLNALRAAGVTVALGMDGTSINDDEDMFAEIRLALRLARPPSYDDTPPAPHVGLELATASGAALLGQADRLGRLAPGYAADLVLVCLDRITWPWVAPDADLRDLIVLRARSGDVDRVVIAGKTVYADGRPLGFDLESAGRELAAHLDAAPCPDDAAAAAARLRPHLEAFYRAWPTPELEPYARHNSRT